MTGSNNTGSTFQLNPQYHNNHKSNSFIFTNIFSLNSNKLAKKLSNNDTTLVNSNHTANKNSLNDIQWSMIDKKRYFPLTVINMFAVRSFLYPLTLVRTRLQVQTRGSLYTGTFNALGSIAKYEGFLGLYKGFWVNSLQLFPHVLYITSYEVISELVLNAP